MHKYTLGQSQYSHKDFEGVIKLALKVVILKKQIQMIPFKYVVNYTNLQHGNNQSHIIHINKYYFHQYTRHRYFAYTFISLPFR